MKPLTYSWRQKRSERKNRSHQSIKRLTWSSPSACAIGGNSSPLRPPLGVRLSGSVVVIGGLSITHKHDTSSRKLVVTTEGSKTPRVEELL